MGSHLGHGTSRKLLAPFISTMEPFLCVLEAGSCPPELRVTACVPGKSEARNAGGCSTSSVPFVMVTDTLKCIKIVRCWHIFVRFIMLE